MPLEEIDRRLKKIIIDILQDKDIELENKITLDCNLMDDLGFDSLLFIQLIVEVEKEFKIEFKMSDLNLSVMRIYKNLQRYLLTHIG